MFPPAVLPLDIEEIYDESFYRASNPGLANLNDRDLLRHFLTTGVSQGLRASPFFDVSSYRDSNSDLKNLDNQQLVNHFLAVGVSEDRQFSPFIDLDFYQQNNTDLAGLDRAQLFEHLKNFGVAEGRRFSPSIDLNSYRASNPNFAGFSNEQLFDQFQLSGTFVPPPTTSPPTAQFFDAEFYRKTNPDLATAGIVTDAQLLEHFQNFGLDDADRKFSPVLDLDYYLANNSDLVVAGIDTRREAYNHFAQFGLDEGRRFSQFFDVNYYLDNNRRDNRTLREAGVTPRQAFADFQNTGLEQGLRPSLLFDPDYYRFNNPDLDLSQGTRLSNKQLFEHFQLSGLREGRRSSVFFDPDAIAALIRADVQTGSVDPSQVFIPSVKWNIPANGTLSYSFVTTASAFLYEGRETGVNELTPEIKQNIRNILAQYSQIIPVNFVEVPDRPPNIGQLRFMFSNADRTGQSDPSGYAYYPSDPGNDVVSYPSRSVGGDVHLRLNPNINFADAPGNAGYEFLVQKVGQALGLSTPLAPPLNFSPDRNNNTNSVMSSNQAGRFASTPMSYDVRALQFLYGASYFNNTDTTYRIDGSNILQKRTIWDSGGVDTLDFTGLGALPLRFNNFDYYFDMNEGGHNTTQIALNVTYSIPNPNSTTAAPLPDTVFRADDYSTIVAFGSQIENLRGSGGNDEILGNNLGNDIKGGEGDDRITAARGADTLSGGGGVDTFVFAAGDGSLNREGADIIIDFQDGVDRIGLALGLSFGSLSIAPGANANDTSIRIASTGEYLAVLTGVPSTAITSADFTFG